jgi:Fe-S-cluster containining protein
MRDLAVEAVLQGTIRVGSESLPYRSSFPSGLRFRCLADCGLCCRTYRIPLTRQDLKRLKQVVDPERCQRIASAGKEIEGSIAAFMENAGGCCYLDEQARCSLYGHRPLYCRTYPLVRDGYEHLEMSVDYTCPGVGEGDALSGEQVEEAFTLEMEARSETANLQGSTANYRVICSSLRAMGVYTEAELIRFVCSRLVDSALRLRQSRAIAAYLVGAGAALTELMARTGSIADGDAADGLVEEVVRRLSGTPPAGGGVALSDRAAQSLAGYLQEWTRRQALLRYVHAAALAHPGGANVLHSFFRFLVQAASDILEDSETASRERGERSVSPGVMREAIGNNEGPLRRSCASVVSSQ